MTIDGTWKLRGAGRSCPTWGNSRIYKEGDVRNDHSAEPDIAGKRDLGAETRQEGAGMEAGLPLGRAPTPAGSARCASGSTGPESQKARSSVRSVAMNMYRGAACTRIPSASS
jgi:hypothetical protein